MCVIILLSTDQAKSNCEAPRVVENTVTQPTNLTRAEIGSSIVWSCVEDYTMEGDTDVIVWVCSDNGTWTGDQPNCKAVTCGTPPTPAFATILNNGPYRVGNTVNYQCDEGYMPSLGKASLSNTCKPDGSWTDIHLECIRSCPGYTFPYSNHICFKRRARGTYRRGWNDAREVCEKHNSTMATVKDAETHHFLQEKLQTVLTNDPGDIWIGAREGQDWMWNNSRNFITRLFWRETIFETNATECISLEYYPTDKFWWSTDECSSSKHFICQTGSPCRQIDDNFPRTTLEYRSNCYYFSRTSMSWEMAGTICGNLGGFLAEPLDESTNKRLAVKARFLNITSSWWIGGKDFDINNGTSWFWVDNTRVMYFHWASSEPNRRTGRDNCVQINTSDYLWYDLSCDSSRRAWCQIGFEACGDPGEPVHGYRMPDDVTTFLVGTNVEFSCDPGYWLHGARFLTCLTNGTWDFEKPSCKRKGQQHQQESQEYFMTIAIGVTASFRVVLLISVGLISCRQFCYVKRKKGAGTVPTGETSRSSSPCSYQESQGDYAETELRPEPKHEPLRPTKSAPSFYMAMKPILSTRPSTLGCTSSNSGSSNDHDDEYIGPSFRGREEELVYASADDPKYINTASRVIKGEVHYANTQEIISVVVESPPPEAKTESESPP